MCSYYSMEPFKFRLLLHSPLLLHLQPCPLGMPNYLEGKDVEILKPFSSFSTKGEVFKVNHALEQINGSFLITPPF